MVARHISNSNGASVGDAGSPDEDEEEDEEEDEDEDGGEDEDEVQAARTHPRTADASLELRRGQPPQDRRNLLTLRKVYAMADPSSTTGPFDLETWVEETLQQPWLVGGLSDEELEVLSAWAGAVLLDGRLWQEDGILHGTCEGAAPEGDGEGDGEGEGEGEGEGVACGCSKWGLSLGHMTLNLVRCAWRKGHHNVRTASAPLLHETPSAHRTAPPPLGRAQERPDCKFELHPACIRPSGADLLNSNPNPNPNPNPSPSPSPSPNPDPNPNTQP